MRRKLEPCVENGWYVSEGAADGTRTRASRVKIVDVHALIISPLTRPPMTLIIWDSDILTHIYVF